MVNFVITGFGDFAGVRDNPTEFIAKNIEDFLHKRKSSDEVKIFSSTPLKVSADAVQHWLVQEADQVHSELSSTAEVIWVGGTPHMLVLLQNVSSYDEGILCFASVLLQCLI